MPLPSLSPRAHRLLLKLGNACQGRSQLLPQLGSVLAKFRILSAEVLNFCFKRHTASIP